MGKITRQKATWKAPLRILGLPCREPWAEGLTPPSWRQKFKIRGPGMNLLPVPTQASAGLRSGVAHHDTVRVPHTIFSVYTSHVGSGPTPSSAPAKLMRFTGNRPLPGP